ncbi:MAG TPA: glycosyltransferase [Opitutaceae bacterium]
MIFFDVTKAAAAEHRSGLMRVSSRLREEFGPVVTPVAWKRWDRRAHATDWMLTPELFSEAERPGLWNLLHAPPCRLAAIFHDAIPLKWPHITWPQSVARHAEYLKMLAEFDRVFAVSAESRRDLIGFWQWQGVKPRAVVDVVALGADFNATPRITARSDLSALNAQPSLLCIGILEPRKNQAFLLDVCDALWRDGLGFDLHLVGRVNPHFGGPIATKIKALRKRWPGLHYHAAASDETVARLYAGASASVFPTIAEGCGLPLLESLWRGVPCVCSDLPVLRENADAGGCIAVPVNDAAGWMEALGRILTDRGSLARLTREAQTRALPTWAEAARAIRAALAS